MSNSNRICDDEHWKASWQGCHFCHQETGYFDRVCGTCRADVPEYIPFEQVKQYIERLKDVKSRSLAC